MKLTKKALLLRLSENLNEMPMTFDTPDSRPNPDVERDLANKDHTFKKVNFPKDVEQPHSNFEELLASKRYKQIVDNVRNNFKLQLILKFLKYFIKYLISIFLNNKFKKVFYTGYLTHSINFFFNTNFFNYCKIKNFYKYNFNRNNFKLYFVTNKYNLWLF
jgi:hypothetical protein